MGELGTMPARRAETIEYRGSGPTGFVVRLERWGGMEILRYEGRHDCSDGDHQHDTQVLSHVVKRIETGCNRFLVDVRGLHVSYTSGVGDLVRSLEPLSAATGVRFAILWDPKRCLPGMGSLLRGVGWAFTDEDAAVASLCSDEARREPPTSKSE